MIIVTGKISSCDVNFVTTERASQGESAVAGASDTQPGRRTCAFPAISGQSGIARGLETIAQRTGRPRDAPERQWRSR